MNKSAKIYKNVTLGKDALLYPPCILGMPPRRRVDGELPLVIGDGAVIRAFTTIYAGNRIGNRVRIHSNCFLELVSIGNDVFIGPHVVFVDDPHPMNCEKYQECLGGPVIEDLVRIGSNSTIMPGVRIGRNSLVGAGSLVIDDVPPDSVAAGHPAKVIKKIAELKCIKGFYERPYSWPPYIKCRRHPDPMVSSVFHLSAHLSNS